MYDVFISHSSKDKDIAELICRVLESNGIRCWIAPRDITGGDDWSASITNAIGSTKVFIVIYSENSASSTQVPKEIALADSAHSHIIPYKLDDTELSASFKYYLTTNHWVNASRQDYNLDGLMAAVQHALGRETATNVTVNNVTINNNMYQPAPQYAPAAAPAVPQQAAAVPQYAAAPNAAKPSKIKPIIFIAAGVALVLAIVVSVVLISGGKDESSYEPDDDRISAGDIVTDDAENDDENTDKEPEKDDDSVPVADSDGGDDILYIPTMLEPYENHCATILADDPNNSFTVLGESHSTGIILNGYEGSYICLSNADGYEKLSFTLARIDNTVRGENVFHIYLDGVEQKQIKGNADFMPQTVEYDISGVKQIKIEMEQNYGVRADYALMDIYFSRNDAQPEVIISESSSDDVASAVSDILPYENVNTRILDNDFNESFTVLGESYNTGIILNAYDASYVCYNNAEGYEKLRFTVARFDNTDRGENAIHIYLDGKEQKVINCNADFMPQSFEYDIAGAKQIKIEMEQSYDSRADYALMDVYFTKNGAEPEIAVPEYDAPDVASATSEKLPYENCNTSILDNDPSNSYTVLCEQYDSGILLNAYDASYIIFSNMEGYEKLSFTLSRLDNTDRGDNSIHIYFDGKEQKAINTNKSYMPKSFEYDITGVKQIKIRIEQSYDSRAVYALQDMYFTKNGKEPDITPTEYKVYDTANSPVDKPPYENYNADVIADDPNNAVIMGGKEYQSGIVLNAYTESYIIFHNKEGYDKLSFIIGKVDGTADGSNTVRIWLDNGEQPSIALNGMPQPLLREYDISDCEQIIIGIDGSYDSRALVGLVDISFTNTDE